MEKDTNSLNRKLGASLSMLNMFASVALGLVYTPFVLRFLGQSEYGIFTLANSLISYLSILDLGFGNTLVRYTSRARAQGKDEKNIYGMFLLFYAIISTVALVAGTFLYGHLDSFFSTSFVPDEVVILKQIYVVLLINTVISFPTSVFSSIIRSHEKFVFANGLNLIANVGRHVLNLVVLYIGFRSVSLAVLSLIFTVAVAIVNIIFCFRKLHIRIGFSKFRASFYREVFLYSFFILVDVIVSQLYNSTDNVVLGKFCGSAVVAVYGIGMVFESYFMQFSTSIAGVFLPHISKLVVQPDGKPEISRLFVKVGRIQFAVLMLVLVGYIVLGQQFIELWAGPGYQDAYYIALVIMIPDMIPLSQNLGISVLQANNKHGVRSMMYLVIAILNVAMTIPMAIWLGGFGAALCTAFCSLLGQILFMNWYYWKRAELDIPGYWKTILRLVLRAVPVFGIFWLADRLVPFGGWAGLICKGVAALAVTAPYYYAFILEPADRKMIRGALKRR